MINLEIDFESDPLKKSQICNEILNSLPNWFGIAESIEEYTEEVKELLFISIKLDKKVIGFCSLKINYSRNADLLVLGILEEYHRKNIGSQLISFINQYCRKNNIPFMSVKTLSEHHPDKYYMKTRKFYEKCGFNSFEEFPDFWDEKNPCLYMIRKVI